MLQVSSAPPPNSIVKDTLRISLHKIYPEQAKKKKKPPNSMYMSHWKPSIRNYYISESLKQLQCFKACFWKVYCVPYDIFGRGNVENHLDNLKSWSQCLVLKHSQIASFIAKYSAYLKNDSLNSLKLKWCDSSPFCSSYFTQHLMISTNNLRKYESGMQFVKMPLHY